MIAINMLSNIIGRLWGFASIFVFVPFYMSYLGDSNYGYVGLYSTVLAVFSIADLGLSASLTKEFSKNETMEYKANLLRTYETIYGAIIVILMLFSYFCSESLSSYLFSDNGYLVEKNSPDILFLIGLSVVMQVPASLYVGSIMGLEKQVVCNSIQVAWGLIRGIGTVICLAYVRQDIITFFICQLISNMLYLIALKIYVSRVVKWGNPKFRFDLLKKTYRYAFGMAWLTIMSSIILQMDKVYVAGHFALSVVGHYSILVTYSSIPLIVITTLARAAFPRLSRLSHDKKITELNELYNILSDFSCVIILPLSAFLVCLAPYLLHVWTGSSFIYSNNMNMVVVLLLAAQTIQSLTVMPYHLALSFSDVKINISVSLISIPLLMFMVFLLGDWYGIVGVSLAIFLNQLIIFIPYMLFLHDKFIPNISWRWLKDVFLKCAVCLVFIAVYHYFSVLVPSSFKNVYGLILGGGGVVLTMLILLLMSPLLKSAVLSYLKEKYCCHINAEGGE